MTYLIVRDHNNGSIDHFSVADWEGRSEEFRQRFAVVERDVPEEELSRVLRKRGSV